MSAFQRVKSEAPKRLKGRVVRVTLRRLKNGELFHDTSIEFDPGTAYKSVRITGHLPYEGWYSELLKALQSRYDVPNLPEPKWWGR